MTRPRSDLQRRQSDRTVTNDRHDADAVKWRPNDEVPAKRREDADPRDRDEEQERRDRRGS